MSVKTPGIAIGDLVDRGGWFRVLVPVLVVTGFIPLLYWHFAGLLSRPHYQFLLLLPVALWMLSGVSPKGVSQGITAGSSFAAVILVMLSAVLLSVATWAWSPWIAAVAFILSLVSLVIRERGWSGLSQWSAVCIFCLTFIPLPFGLDEDLIVRLRGVTTRWTSRFLDELGILHQQYSHVIELPGKSLFIADACSGIHSLYVLLAMALFVALYFRRHVLHAVLLLGSTFGLVLIENIARIAAVAVAWGYGRDFSAGLRHSALGVMLFCISAMLILTTDQLLLFILSEDPFSPLKKLFRRQAPEQVRQRKTATDVRASEAGFGSPVWYVVLVAFPVLGIAQMIRMPSEVPTFAAIFGASLDLPALGREVLPETMQGFLLTDYEIIDRVEGDPFGNSSQRWTYRRGALEVGVSLDYPYDGVKDMCPCYDQIGWRVHSRRMLQELTEHPGEADLPATGSGPAVMAHLHREFYGNGLLIFSTFTPSGQIYALDKEEARGKADIRITRRFASFGDKDHQDSESRASGQTYLQVHLLARQAGEFSEEDQDAVLAIFTESRRILTDRVVELLSTERTGAAVSGGDL